MLASRMPIDAIGTVWLSENCPMDGTFENFVEKYLITPYPNLKDSIHVIAIVLYT